LPSSDVTAAQRHVDDDAAIYFRSISTSRQSKAGMQKTLTLKPGDDQQLSLSADKKWEIQI
jgi:hypothetical protein